MDHTAAMSGAEVGLLNLVLHLDKSRVEPEVLLFEEGPLAERFRAFAKTSILQLDERVGHASKDTLGLTSLGRMREVLLTLGFILRVARFMRKAEVDLVHTHSLKAAIIGGVAGRLAGKRVIWRVQDRITDDYLPGRVAAAFRMLARVIPVRVVGDSLAVVQTINGDRPLGKRFAVVHEGTKLEEAVLRPSTKVEKFGIVGRISRWKGQDVFIRAAVQVHGKYPQTRFQIIGGPLFREREFDDYLRQLTKELGAEEFIEFLGFRADVPERIADLDVVVHASTIGEPFGQVIIEGMAAAKPVIATRGGGVPEIINHGEDGLLVPMGDAAALAEAMCQVMENPEEARRMGARGRERVSGHFRIEHTAAKMTAVYESVLGG